MSENVTVTHTGAPEASGQGAAGAIRSLVARSPAVRSVVKSAPVQHQIRTWRALGVVRGRGRFLALQHGSRRIGRYGLRDSGMTFHVRHRTGDVAILNKIFARDTAVNSYAPPAAIADRIAAGGAPRILDVGANIGMFGVYALDRWPGARITAFEPDPDNLRVLRKTVVANAVGDRWQVVPKAVSNHVGELSFVADLRAEAHIAGAREKGTITVPTVDLFDFADEPIDLIKMDIEGGEWAILADPRMAALDVKAIRLEWHTMLCPAENACAEAGRLLRAAGFAHVLDASHEHERNGVLWAWREA